jgi:hypothetical protein
LNILCLDGGVAALAHLRFLRHVEQQRPGFLERADLLAGTSDGALAALYLAPRVGAGQTGTLRALDGCIDFFHEVLGVFQLRPGTLARFALGRGRQALAARVREVFERHLGVETLGGLEQRGRKVMVLALERRTWKRRAFRSFDLETQAEREQSLVDLALACSAFPVVLPPHRNPADGREYLDAAPVTNNPALVALREALAHLRRHGGNGPDAMERLRLLSLGATESSGAGSTDERQGLLSWLPETLDRLGFAGWSQLLARHVYLPDFMLQGSVDIIDLQCQDLLGLRYHRVRAALPELDYLASVALPPAILRRRLDALAARWLRPDLPALGWVDATWLAPPGAVARPSGSGTV